MERAYIYKIINPNGKIYIGSTINIKDRIYRYKNAKVKNQIKIYNSIIKYGWDKHSFEIIFECNKEDRNLYESYFGCLYNSIGENGLNLCLPKSTDNYISMSSETKKKIGDAHRGKIISDKQKLQITNSLKKWHIENEHPMKGKTPWNKNKSFLPGELNPMYGVKRSDEWKKEHSIRMSELNPKGENHHKSKLVLDVITGIYYECLKDVSVYNNILYSTLKTRILNKKNYRFKYI